FAQLANRDAQIFGLIGVGAPNCMQQRAMREHLPGMLGHVDQKIELLRRQMRLLAANNDAVLGDVDQEVAGVKLWSLSIGYRAAAELSPNASLQLLNAEGLRNVVVGACIKRFDFHQVLIADGEHDY